MSALSSQWHSTCSRLNVKPKQFAMLLVITFGALGVLGLKMFVLKPKKAGASPPAAAAADASPKDGGATANTPTDASRAASPSAAVLGLPIVTVAFESRPMRDPFDPFFIYKPGSEEELDSSMSDGQGVVVAPRAGSPPPKSGTGSAKGSAKGATAPGGSTNKKGATAPAVVQPPALPEGPQGLVLKAIISGRVAVLNTMSVEEGDVIQDAASQTYTVEKIKDRSIVLTDGHRRFTVGYSAAPLKPAKSGKTR